MSRAAPLRALTPWAAGAVLAAAGVLALPGVAAARELIVVQSNVGNINVPGCGDHVFKLCLRPVEERAAAAFRRIDPDVVAFQEILPPALCRQTPSGNPNNLCSAPLRPPSQVTRLLGGGYSEDCDIRFGWDCLAVARRAGSLPGGLRTRPVQPGCEDTGFTLNVGTLRVGGWPIAVSSAHPDSRDVPCRTQQLRDFFERAVPPRGPALLLGDFNLDPYREDDESVRYWKTQVPRRFDYASGRDVTLAPGISQLDPTGLVLDQGVIFPAPPFGGRAIDHVLVRGLSGRCEVRRVDGGGGMDHLAQLCRIQVGRSAAPRLVLRRRGCTVAARFVPRPSHLRGIRFRIGRRTVTDRRSPFLLRLRGGERRRRSRISVRALLEGPDGPRLARRVGPCLRRAVRRRPIPRFTG